MSLKQRVDVALQQCDGCCLDDSDDRALVATCLIESLTCGGSEDFEAACTALRWFLATGKGDIARMKEHIAVALEALGEE